MYASVQGQPQRTTRMVWRSSQRACGSNAWLLPGGALAVHARGDDRCIHHTLASSDREHEAAHALLNRTPDAVRGRVSGLCTAAFTRGRRRKV